ncbi:hypothetical protein [Amycolatopsis sp. NBRC 101858]|uniref:hypothetical protein n=1 Tax=Amycolatopsis sp. NBRC 101858 TaxID=3032200 RepID=UPI002553F1EB|nr:hypothetical protein [Amycolatopsis sp. NBRC 101858]
MLLDAKQPPLWLVFRHARDRQPPLSADETAFPHGNANGSTPGWISPVARD